MKFVKSLDFEEKMKIVEGVHQIYSKHPTLLQGVNSYLIIGDDETLLIDSGLKNQESFNKIKKVMEDLGVAVNSLSLIIMTKMKHYQSGV